MNINKALWRFIVNITLCIQSFAMSTAAQDVATSLDHCKQITSPKARLKCYDAIEIAKPSATTLSSQSDGKCDIEDWQYSEKADSIYINGTTTCPGGKFTYRLYDGETGEFIASNFTYFEGYAFQSYADGRVPKKLKIKYTIDQK